MAYKVVLLGGSFDPIHYGHLYMLKEAVRVLGAKEGWFILARQANLKDRDPASYEVRADFIKAMIRPYKKLKLCRIEEDLPVPNYTVDTLSLLRKKYPKIDFYYLIGADQYLQLDKWHKPKKLLKLARFVLVERPGYPLKEVDLPMISVAPRPVSSTAIREGRSFDTHPYILKKMMMDGIYGKDRLAHYLSDKRGKHCQRVAKLCVSLANSHGLNLKEAYGLGMAHDLLKEISLKEQKSYIDPRKVDLYPDYYWHGVSAASLASRSYKVKDKAWLKALKGHGDGRFKGPLAACLYLSDKCEPHRKYDPSSYLALAQQNLGKAVKEVQAASAAYQALKGKK